MAPATPCRRCRPCTCPPSALHAHPPALQRPHHARRPRWPPCCDPLLQRQPCNAAQLLTPAQVCQGGSLMEQSFSCAAVTLAPRVRWPRAASRAPDQPVLPPTCSHRHASRLVWNRQPRASSYLSRVPGPSAAALTARMAVASRSPRLRTHDPLHPPMHWTLAAARLPAAVAQLARPSLGHHVRFPHVQHPQASPRARPRCRSAAVAPNGRRPSPRGTWRRSWLRRVHAPLGGRPD